MSRQEDRIETRKLLKRCQERAARISDIGPVKEWSGNPCVVCGGKHDAINIEIDQIKIEDGARFCCPGFAWACPHYDDYKKSLWQLLQEGVTRIEVISR